MKIKLGKLLAGAARAIAENPNKVKIAAAVVGITLPSAAVKALDLAAKAKAAK